MDGEQPGDVWGIPGRPETYDTIRPSWISIISFTDANGKDHVMFWEQWLERIRDKVLIRRGAE